MTTQIYATPLGHSSINFQNVIPFYSELTQTYFDIQLWVIGAIVGCILLGLVAMCIKNESVSKSLLKELESFDANMTVVVFCISILFVPVYYMAVLFINMFDKYLIETYGSYASILANDYICSVMTSGLNISGDLFIALCVWLVVNVAHMICLAIDEIKEKDQ